MLNLMKYEFRKNRTVLFIVTGGLLLLQLFYMFNVFTFKETDAAEFRLVASMVLLYIFAIVCFFTVLVLAVGNYSRELNAKSSYLIFMTPNSSYSIIFSKMLYTLLIGLVLLGIIIGLASVDFELLRIPFPEAESFLTMIGTTFEAYGIPVGDILLTTISGLATFLIFFFAIVSLTYLTVTLSATFLQNSKAKSFVSVALFLAITYGLGKLAAVLPDLYENPATPMEAVLTVLPTTLFYLAVMVVCIFICGKLLEKKVSL